MPNVKMPKANVDQCKAEAMNTSRKIQIIVDGVVVTGVVRTNNDEETVEITSPFKGWKTSKSLRYYRIPNAQSVVVRRPTKPDAKEMLRRLYRLCVVLKGNRPLVAESFEEVEERIASLHADGLVNNGMFEAFRKVFRLLCLDGDMTELEHIEAVERLRIKHSQYHHRRAQILDRWFMKMFPDPVEDEGLREQIVRYLKQEERAESGLSGRVTVRRY